MSNQRQEFERAIQNNPYDLITRKIFADWLDEFGDGSDADLAAEQRNWTRKKQDAIVWLTEFVDYLTQESADYDTGELTVKISYDKLMAAAQESITGYSYGITLLFNTPDRVYSDNEKFWEMFELATDQKVDDRHKNAFIGCAC